MRKENMKQIGAVVLVWLLALGMIGCQVASAPTDVTDEALPAVTTEATEPEATRFVSTSRYQPTLPTEAPKPTQATEETGATQPTEVEGDASSYTPAPTEAPASTEAPPPAATEPPATEPPVTEAPATEAPAVSLDYSTAASYGNSYMASTYGCIVDYDVEGYYPADITPLSITSTMEARLL